MQMTTHCWTELSSMSNKSTAKLHLREIWTSLLSYRLLSGNARYWKLPKPPYYVDYVNTVNFFRLVYWYPWWIGSTSSMINSTRHYLFMVSILTAMQCSVLSGNWIAPSCGQQLIGCLCGGNESFTKTGYLEWLRVFSCSTFIYEHLFWLTIKRP